jgi:hypothetical protein
MLNKMAKDKKTMLIPTTQQFSLAKVKLAKNGGLTVHYEVTEVIGEESYANKFLVESAKDIHPDLQGLFDKLRPIMGRIYHLTSFLSLVEISDFKATPKQKEAARKYADELLEKIEVRGVSFSGQDDNIGIVLTALMTSGNNQKSAINSPRLKFNSEVYGFEEDLETICGEIETEVYEFLFRGKKAQLELFGGTTEEDETETNGDENDEHEPVEQFPDVDDPAVGGEETDDEELGETEVNDDDQY